MWLELGTKHQKTLMKDPKTPQWNMAALCRTALAPRSVLGANIGPVLPERWGPFVGGVQPRVEHTIFRTTLGARCEEWIQWMLNPDAFHWKPAVEPPTPDITKGQSIIKRNSVKKRSVRNTRRTLAILPQWQKYWGVMNHYEAYASQDTKSLQFNREFCVVFVPISLGGALFQTS